MQTVSKSFLYFICLVSAMGGLLFGYDWVVIGGAKPFYELYFGIDDSPLMQGIAMTTALVGCLVGAMVAGALADRYGRKPLLMLSAVLFTVSAVATGLFNDFTLFNIARFIGGMGIGVASALAPMYIAEVSPAEIRGRMVSLNQMTIVLGILGAQIVNMLLARDTADRFVSFRPKVIGGGVKCGLRLCHRKARHLTRYENFRHFWLRFGGSGTNDRSFLRWPFLLFH